jgi:redox-regulated HSP33 family molecular chaperone
VLLRIVWICASSKVRKRLPSERAEKFVYLFHTLRALHRARLAEKKELQRLEKESEAVLERLVEEELKSASESECESECECEVEADEGLDSD